MFSDDIVISWVSREQVKENIEFKRRGNIAILLLSFLA